MNRIKSQIQIMLHKIKNIVGFTPTCCRNFFILQLCQSGGWEFFKANNICFLYLMHLCHLLHIVLNNSLLQSVPGAGQEHLDEVSEVVPKQQDRPSYFCCKRTSEE